MLGILQAAFIPLSLTVCVIVVIEYAPAMYRNGKPEHYAHWLIMGIVIGFVAKTLNMLYVSFYLLNHENLIEQFAIAHILLCQLPTIAAAFCHLKAAQLYLKRERSFNVYRFTLVLMVATCLFLACAAVMSKGV